MDVSFREKLVAFVENYFIFNLVVPAGLRKSLKHGIPGMQRKSVGVLLRKWNVRRDPPSSWLRIIWGGGPEGGWILSDGFYVPEVRSVCRSAAGESFSLRKARIRQ